MSDNSEWQVRGRVLDLGRRALVMGIVNVTPDSFSDGGRLAGPAEAVAHALELIRQGADLLDVGGESTRPGAVPVPPEEELRRVVPVIGELAARTDVPLSVDTTKAEVARQALAAGAHIVNDVSACGDAHMAEVVRASGAGLVLMHMKGTPATMQADPTYDDVVAEVAGFLEARLQQAAKDGIAGRQVVLDPGIGFGKTVRHNLELLANLEQLGRLGRPVCLGLSRKRFIGKLLDRDVNERLAGSLVAATYALARRTAHIIRAHDVAATRDAAWLVAAVGQAARLSDR
jgi:dihydropteroate synthase